MCLSTLTSSTTQQKKCEMGCEVLNLGDKIIGNVRNNIHMLERKHKRLFCEKSQGKNIRTLSFISLSSSDNQHKSQVSRTFSFFLRDDFLVRSKQCKK